MDKKQSLAFLLSAMMVATPFSAFAAEDGTAPADADASAKAATEQSVENNQAKGEDSVQEDAQLDENELPIVPIEPGEGTGEEKKDETPASNAWEATDFTYGEWVIDSNAMLCPSNDTEAYLKTTIWVVTGLSDSGKAKLENNKDLVIPAKDPDGKKVQGVGKDAFKKMGLTSVQFPENVKTANDTNWDSNVKERGDFFIGNLAFQSNDLKEVTLPEGVFYVAPNGFSKNPNLKEVTFPSTIKLIGNSAFAACAIDTLNFPETTDFPLAIDNIAFFTNKIKSVWLPDKTEKVTNMAFRNNTGVENGIVHLYIPKTKGSYVDNNAYQKPFVGDAIPTEAWAEKPWCTAHFTFDGTTITGLSESGKIKIQNDTNLVLPDQTEAGEDVTAIGNGTYGVGTFGYTTADGTVYAPDSVKLPAKLESIGNFAFSAVVDTKTSEVKHGVKAVEFPETLKTIGNTAFQNAPLTEVSIPDSVTSVGSGAFTNTEQATTHIEKVKLSKGMTTIPNSMFTNQKIKNVEIPEGIKSIGSRAFAGNYVETLKISGTVEEIDDYAFWNNQMKELEIPGNVKIIGKYAFQRTQEYIKATINKVVLHEGLESIGKKAFYQTLTSECKSIDLPTTVNVLDAAAFEGNAKVTLTSLVEDQVNATGDYTKVAAAGAGHEIVLVHKVTFDAGEGKADAETARADKDGKLAELPTAARDGYIFKGWFTAAEGGDAVTADTVFDKDTTVFAHWKAYSVVTFDAGEGKSDAETARADKDGKLAELPTAARDGYTFEGWFTAAEGGEAVTADTVFDKDTTVFAHWKAYSVVTFDAGEGKSDAETARADKDGKLAELPNAARDGYIFEGWFTAAEGGDAVTADTVFDKDTTVFAHWKKNIVSATPSVKLSTSTYTYNGKVKTPGVKVSVNGTVLTKDNYSVSYGKGRKNVGKYTVKVTLKNDYAGSKTVSFKINPPKSAVKKLKKGKKSFTVYVKKQSKQTSGYQVQYSTSKKFKSPKAKNLTSYKKTTLKVKKLKKHKKYYVRVRTYKKVGKTKYYSGWSSAKSVKTK